MMIPTSSEMMFASDCMEKMQKFIGSSVRSLTTECTASPEVQPIAAQRGPPSYAEMTLARDIFRKMQVHIESTNDSTEYVRRNPTDILALSESPPRIRPLLQWFPIGYVQNLLFSGFLPRSSPTSSFCVPLSSRFSQMTGLRQFCYAGFATFGGTLLAQPVKYGHPYATLRRPRVGLGPETLPSTNGCGYRANIRSQSSLIIRDEIIYLIECFGK